MKEVGRKLMGRREEGVSTMTIAQPALYNFSESAMPNCATGTTDDFTGKNGPPNQGQPAPSAGHTKSCSGDDPASEVFVRAEPRVLRSRSVAWVFGHAQHTLSFTRTFAGALVKVDHLRSLDEILETALETIRYAWLAVQHCSWGIRSHIHVENSNAGG
jgi:hypothetical protein